jgi:excinuclease ABC subunit A
MTVDEAAEFFAAEVSLRRSLSVLQEVGVGDLRLGEPAAERSGGEIQSIKLVAELQRSKRGR